MSGKNRKFGRNSKRPSGSNQKSRSAANKARNIAKAKKDNPKGIGHICPQRSTGQRDKERVVFSSPVHEHRLMNNKTGEVLAMPRLVIKNGVTTDVISANVRPANYNAADKRAAKVQREFDTVLV